MFAWWDVRVSVAIVAVILLIGVRREFATFAIAAGVIGALMMS